MFLQRNLYSTPFVYSFSFPLLHFFTLYSFSLPLLITKINKLKIFLKKIQKQKKTKHNIKKIYLEGPTILSQYFWPSLIVCWVYRPCIEGNAYFRGEGGLTLVGAILVHAIWFN